MRAAAVFTMISVALAVPGCGPSEDPNPAGAQLVAATEVAAAIAADPGPIEVVCVAYSGDWEDPGLPDGVPGIRLAYGEGCQEVDGQLFSQPDGDRAIWLGVGEPEATGGETADVRVYTSTGLDDAASYRCAVRREGGGWTVEGCDLEAIG